MTSNIYIKAKGRYKHLLSFISYLDSSLSITDCDKQQSCVIVKGLADWDIASALPDLEQKCKNNHLIVEIFLESKYMHFTEHMVISKGSTVLYNIYDYSIYHWDKNKFPNIEDFNALEGTAFTDEDFFDVDNICVGAFPGEFTI